MSETNQELKTLDWNEALKDGIKGVSGKTYRFESELSSRRWFEAMKQRLHMAHGLPSVAEYHAALKLAYDDLNSGKLADGIVKLDRLIEASNQAHNRFIPGMMLCALYFNSEDEDRQGFNETDLMQKIEDWRNYGVTGFFLLAFKLSTLPAERLKAITPKFLEDQKTMSVTDLLQKG